MTREEFIGKLRSIYVGEENAIDEIVSEYDKLKGALQTHEILLKTNVEEIDRLNNIINELEKYINKLMEQTRTAIAFNKGINDVYETKKYERDNYLFEMVLDKLKALKEDNK